MDTLDMWEVITTQVPHTALEMGTPLQPSMALQEAPLATHMTLVSQLPQPATDL